MKKILLLIGLVFMFGFSSVFASSNDNSNNYIIKNGDFGVSTGFDGLVLSDKGIEFGKQNLFVEYTVNGLNKSFSLDSETKKAGSTLISKKKNSNLKLVSIHENTEIGIKTTSFVENTSRFDYSNVKYWYVHRLNENLIVDFDGNLYSFDSQIVLNNSEKPLPLKFNIMGRMQFDFKDLQETGFEVTDFVLGDGKQFGFSDEKVVAIGFTKNQGILLEDEVVEIDPLSRVSALTLNSGENSLRCAISDGTHGYFGTQTTPVIVVKVQLSDMTRVSALTLNTGEDNVCCAISDGTYGYFGTYTSPGRVVKVLLSDMTRVSALTFNTGENQVYSAIIVSGYGYFGTHTSPGRVVKVLLSDMTRVSALTLNAGENGLIDGITDDTHGYFGTHTSPAIVVKVNLSTMVRDSALTLNTGEDYVRCAISDGTHGYFGLYPSPGIVVKVQLSDMTRVSALTFNTGENQAYSAIIVSGYGYFGTYTSPGRVVKVLLSDMTRDSALTLNTGEDYLLCATTDSTHGYFGTEKSPGIVVKVNLGNNQAPTITSVADAPDPVKGGTTVTITPTGQADTNSDALYFYCDTSANPTSATTDCSEANASYASPYSGMTCTFNAIADDASHTVYCRVYDGTAYSSDVQTTYTSDSTTVTTTLTSVAGDTTSPYLDDVDDSATDIIVAGEASMLCRFDSTDIIYSSMSAGNECLITGSDATCSLGSLASNTYTRYVSCKDSLGNEQTNAQNLNIDFTVSLNSAPTISSVADAPDPVKGGTTVTITPSGQADADSDALYFYCDSSANPTSVTTDCTEANASYASPYSGMTCTFNAIADDASHTVYCRVYDGTAYSADVSTIYTSDSTTVTTTLTSVAGDTTSPYLDSANDSATDIIVAGEASMLCRFDSTDIVYSSMAGANECSITGSDATCSLGALAQNSYTRYVSCKDSVGNEQTNAQNLNIDFTVDWNDTPTISSVADAPDPVKGGTTVTITPSGQADADSDALYFYCDTSANPTSATTDCSEANASYASPYGGMTCTFNAIADDASHTVYCRVYDGTAYSSDVSTSYTSDSTTVTTTLTSVAGDTTSPYLDDVDDSATDIIVAGEASMLCRFDSTDIVYSSMAGANECSIVGSDATCSLGALSQNSYTRYVSCKDSLDNEQSTAQNIDVTFTVDWNDTPTISSVADAPDPVTNDSNVTFTIDWADGDAGELTKTHVCKTNSITSATGVCDSGSWGDSSTFAVTNPMEITYATTCSDVGTKNYYVFVCDDDNACSASTSGTFTVNNSFSYSALLPVDNSQYFTGEQVSFELDGTGLVDCASNPVTDANVTFRDRTDSADICSDTSGLNSFTYDDGSQEDMGEIFLKRYFRIDFASSDIDDGSTNYNAKILLKKIGTPPEDLSVYLLDTDTEFPLWVVGDTPDFTITGASLGTEFGYSTVALDDSFFASDKNITLLLTCPTCPASNRYAWGQDTGNSGHSYSFLPSNVWVLSTKEYVTTMTWGTGNDYHCSHAWGTVPLNTDPQLWDVFITKAGFTDFDSADRTITSSESVTMTVNEPSGGDDYTKENFTIDWNATHPTETLLISCYMNDTQSNRKDNVCFENSANDGTEACNTTTFAEGSYYVFCNAYDNYLNHHFWSSDVLVVDRTPITLSTVSVESDISSPFKDIINDGNTDIVFTGEADMVCRYSSSDQAYSVMPAGQTCVIDGITGQCTVNDLVVGDYIYYIACADLALNGNTNVNNLDVAFSIGYTAPVEGGGGGDTFVIYREIKIEVIPDMMDVFVTPGFAIVGENVIGGSEKVTIIVRNIGEVDLANVSWKKTVNTGGVGLKQEGVPFDLKVGEQKEFYLTVTLPQSHVEGDVFEVSSKVYVPFSDVEASYDFKVFASEKPAFPLLPGFELPDVAGFFNQEVFNLFGTPVSLLVVLVCGLIAVVLAGKVRA